MTVSLNFDVAQHNLWGKEELKADAYLVKYIGKMKKSAGLLLYRFSAKRLQVFLVHPGGPFWAKKDAGVWSIPKGEIKEGDDALETAKREFTEETGQTINGHFTALQPIKQKGGKEVLAWAVENDVDSSNIKSNEFEMEWPPRSGKKKSFPEIDKAGWFTINEAKEKLNEAQFSLVEQLTLLLEQE